MNRRVKNVEIISQEEKSKRKTLGKITKAIHSRIRENNKGDTFKNICSKRKKRGHVKKKYKEDSR